MNSARLFIREFGPPGNVLEYENIAAPSPLESGEVLVKIFASPVNPADLNWIEGTYGLRPSLPATAGLEGSGIVIESRADDFNCGDSVIFLHSGGTWATHVRVRADALLKLPANIDLLQAAMLKVNPATAWQLLHGFGKAAPGEWIVQNAGNSGVGRCVIQLARDLGIRTISFVRRADLIPELRAVGADHVCIDDDSGHREALDVLGGKNAALAFNAVGGESALRLMNLLRENASHITYGAMARRPLTVPNGLLIFRDLQIRGLWISRWIANAPPAEVSAVYADLADRVLTGMLVQPIDSTHRFEEHAAALARLQSSDRHGKVLFKSEVC